MKKTLEHEKGQSIVIVAVAMIGLIAMLAMVVDAGNAYVQRRQTQNAIDAATQAGTIAFSQNKTSSQILSVVQQYAGANGIDLNKNPVTAYYIVQDANGNQYVVNTPPVGTGQGRDNVITQTNYGGLGVLPIVGIQVVGDKSFPTYFAGVIGFNEMSNHVVSASFAKCGACSANTLFPAAVSANLFTVFGNHWDQLEPNYYYILYENSTLASRGSYGYVQWPGSSATIASNMNNTENNVSATWRVNDSLSGNSTTTADSTIISAFLNRVNGSPSSYVTIPIYDTATPGLGTPGSQSYHITGFARFKITGYYFSGTQNGGNYDKAGTISNGDKFIVAKLEQWTDPQANGGCVNYGICTVKTNPPITQTRALAGTVKINKLTMTSTTATNVHVPVDIMEVIDLSPSMVNNFNDNSTSNNSLRKITAAKTALNTFNGKLIAAKQQNPTWTDQLGLTNFPYSYSTNPAYTSPNCYNTPSGSNKGTWSKLQTGSLVNGLTGSVSTMQTISTTISKYYTVTSLPSGNTPTAGGIKVATNELVTNHKSGSVPIMILATDGRANVLTDGRFEGDSIDLNPCNYPALQAATDQATLAKGKLLDGYPITIFVIASGSEYVSNPSLNSYFQSVASVDTNSSLPHFFAAGDSASLTEIFTNLMSRISQIGTESCKVLQNEAFGPGFSLVATNTSSGKTYPITTSPTGDFVINNIDPGEYTFTSGNNYVGTFNYNTFTLGVGGMVITPSVTVGNDTGTYPIDLYLKTTNTPSCGL